MASASTAARSFSARRDGLVQAGVGQDRAELVAPEARRQVAGAPEGGREARAEAPEALVAVGVPVEVVVLLEVVHVEADQRDAAAGAQRAAPLLLEPGGEVAAVGEAGERVLGREPLELPGAAGHLRLELPLTPPQPADAQVHRQNARHEQGERDEPAKAPRLVEVGRDDQLQLVAPGRGALGGRGGHTEHVPAGRQVREVRHAAPAGLDPVGVDPVEPIAELDAFRGRVAEPGEMDLGLPHALRQQHGRGARLAGAGVRHALDEDPRRQRPRDRRAGVDEHDAAQRGEAQPPVAQAQARRREAAVALRALHAVRLAVRRAAHAPGPASPRRPAARSGRRGTAPGSSSSRSGRGRRRRSGTRWRRRGPAPS